MCNSIPFTYFQHLWCYRGFWTFEEFFSLKGKLQMYSERNLFIENIMLLNFDVLFFFVKSIYHEIFTYKKHWVVPIFQDGGYSSNYICQGFLQVKDKALLDLKQLIKTTFSFLLAEIEFSLTRLFLNSKFTTFV